MSIPPPPPPAADRNVVVKPHKAWWKRWWAITLGVLVVLLVIAAIAGGGDDDDKEAAPDTTEAADTTERADTTEGERADSTVAVDTTEVAAASDAPASDGGRCEAVAPEVVDLILSRSEVGPLTAIDSAAVKSEDFEKVYMVAVKFSTEGVDSETGVWAVNSLTLDDFGGLYAVDGFAQQFTDWFDGDTTDAEFSIADDGVEEAKDCID